MTWPVLSNIVWSTVLLGSWPLEKSSAAEITPVAAGLSKHPELTASCVLQSLWYSTMDIAKGEQLLERLRSYVKEQGMSSVFMQSRHAALLHWERSL